MNGLDFPPGAKGDNATDNTAAFQAGSFQVRPSSFLLPPYVLRFHPFSILPLSFFKPSMMLLRMEEVKSLRQRNKIYYTKY
jgi:hypothetical protein